MKPLTESSAALAGKILLALWIVLFYLFLYTFLHEGGQVQGTSRKRVYLNL
jgi:hypothetical protein